ncbi:MAG TPA: P1 family peptidase, partial [Bacteroidota bacterium]|nr:P1 family peptidase [Bacteroidota bacterium]
ALLSSEKKMQEVHALLLTGGSAYGLAAADGVMRYLEERGIGYRTPWGVVPIVPGAVIFDLNVGSQKTRPTAEAGYAAAAAASSTDVAEGSVGVGAGATVGKWSGLPFAMHGGFAVATMDYEGVRVCAAAVANAVGDVIDADGAIIAGARREGGKWCASENPMRIPPENVSPRGGLNTVLVAIMTDALLAKVDANRVAQRAHDGLARAVRPAHTSHDGDTIFCLSAGGKKSDIDIVAELGAEATSQAIRRAVAALPGT